MTKSRDIFGKRNPAQPRKNKKAGQTFRAALLLNYLPV